MPNYILCTFCTVHLKIVHVTGTTLSFKLDAKFLGDLICFWTCGTGWWAGCTGTLARPWLHRHCHRFTHLRLTFLPHPVANSHHVPNVWLQRKGGSQKLDPPPLFKGGGGSGSPWVTTFSKKSEFSSYTLFFQVIFGTCWLKLHF